MLYEMVELEEGAPVQFLAAYVLRWDTETMGKPTCGFVAIDPGTTHEDLVQLRRIAQRVREELARAKPGSAVWRAMRFILSPPVEITVETADETTDEGPTWESDYWDYTDYPEPD